MPRTDSSIAPPPKPAILFNERFMAARHEEGCWDEKRILKHFRVCKGLSNDDVGAASSTVFQEIRPGAASKTGDFVKEMLGGATVVRLHE